MRMIMIAAAAALALAGAAQAQTRPAEAPAAWPEAAPNAATTRTIRVVELDELPEAARAKVNQHVATRTANEVQQLQQSILAAPDVRSALEAKGFSARDVVMAEMSHDGELMVVTRRLG